MELYRRGSGPLATTLIVRVIIRSAKRQKNADSGAVIFHLVPAFDLNSATVAFDKLLGDEQSNAGAHGTPGREEGIEHTG